MAEAMPTDEEMPPANVFKAKISYDIAYETIDGVKTPRVVKPDFSIGGFGFNLVTRNCQDEEHPYVLYVELSEASKKPLLLGYEFKFTTFSTNFVNEAGKKSKWASPDPTFVRNSSAAYLYSFISETHCDAEIVMEIDDVFPYRNKFTDLGLMEKNRSNCKLVLVDAGNKEIFVNKDILALSSPFFRTMFFGNFKEKDQDVVTLRDVKEMAFLEYLFCVYPPPNRPFAYKRLEILLLLADRFQNDELMASIEKFMVEKKDKTCAEKRLTLILSDAYNMSALFRATLKTMDKTEMKTLTPKMCLEFKKENAELFIARIYGLILKEDEQAKSAIVREEMTETTLTGFDLTTANVFKKKLSFDVHWDEIEGKKIPRVEVPVFSIGGLLFQVTVDNPSDIWVQLAKSSLAMLAPGFEIQVASRCTWNNGTGPYEQKGKIMNGEPCPLVHLDHSDFNYVFDLEFTFHNVFSCPPHFVDAEVAKQKLSDCKIILTDDEDKPVYVHKNILALSSPFFHTLFFGDFKEKDEDVVKLSIVKQKDFLEYLCCVYPPPNLPLTFSRIESLMCQADRFQNDYLISTIVKFLAEKTDKTSKEKLQVLRWADIYHMPTLFQQTLEKMDNRDLKKLEPSACIEFNKESLLILITYLRDKSV